MVRVQKVERENSFGTENRGRVPSDAKELSKGFEVAVLGAIAEADADSVVPGKVDNEYFPSFRKDGAKITGMSEVDGLTKALEARSLEKPVRPDL